MRYIRVSNETWLLKVRGVFWALCKVLYSVCCPFGLFHRLMRGKGELFEVFTARSFPWTDGVLGIGYIFNGTIWPCTSLVSHSCHSGAVANVDFKPRRSRRTDGYVGSSDEAKIVRTATKRRKIFQADRKRGQMDYDYTRLYYTSLRWRGKSSSGSEFRQENGLAIQVFRNSSVQSWLGL